MYEDKELVCKDCGKTFVFSAGEQEFYAEKGFQNEPQRCKECRAAKKNAAKAQESILILPVQDAAALQEYRSSPERTNRYIAASALRR